MRRDTKEFDDMLNGINESKPPAVKVLEAEFVKIYLPIILARHNGQRPSVCAWTNLVGNVFDGITVVNPQGEVLFVTPGLMVNPDFQVDAGFLSMIKDVSVAQSRHMNSDAEYGKHLNADRAKLKFEGAGDHIVDWYKIFARYGYKMVTEGDNPASEVAKAAVETPVKSETKMVWDDADDEFA